MCTLELDTECGARRKAKGWRYRFLSHVSVSGDRTHIAGFHLYATCRTGKSMETVDLCLPGAGGGETGFLSEVIEMFQN